MISRNLTGTGLPPLAAQAIAGTVNDGLTATGTTQATALLISGDLNVFSTVASGTGCILPVGGENDTYSIINDGANALLIYPPVGGTINGGAVNASASLAAGSAIQINFQSSLVSRVIGSVLSLASSVGSALVGFIQAGIGAVARTSQSKMREIVSVADFGAVGAPTDDTAAFQLAANSANFVLVPYLAAGYNVANTISVGSSMFIFTGGFHDSQLVGSANATDLNAISIHAGQISGERLRLIPKSNTLTGANEGEKRGIFISQAEPNLASGDYGDGPFYFNEITTTWTGERTGSGVEGSPTSAMVHALRVGLDVGGADYVLQSAAALSGGLIHSVADTSTGDKIGINSGVSSTASSPGKIYGASSSFTVSGAGSTPQAIGHEVDVFVNNVAGVVAGIGYSAWSGGTHQATAIYAAYAIARSGDVSAVSWQSGFSLYTAAGTLGQPIATTGNLFSTDSVAAITLANIFYFPTMVVSSDILKFPNAALSGNGTLTLAQGYDFTQAAPPSVNTISKLLNDYETGIYTATITPSTSGTVTLDSATDKLSYTKTGNLVTVRGQLNVASVSSPIGVIRISLPYSVADLSEGSGNSAGDVIVSGSVSATMNSFILLADEGLSYASVYIGTGATLGGAAAQQLQAGSWVRICFSYAA